MLNELIAASLTTFAFLGAGLWIARRERYKKPPLPDWIRSYAAVWKWAGIIAAGLMLILILDELQALYVEFANAGRPIEILTCFLSDLRVGVILYISNLLLLGIGAKQLLKPTGNDDLTPGKRNTAAGGDNSSQNQSHGTGKQAESTHWIIYLLIGITIAVTHVQIIMHLAALEMGYLLVIALLLFAVTAGSILKALPLISGYEVSSGISASQSLQRRKMIIIVFVFGSAFLQTMITKAGLLVYLAGLAVKYRSRIKKQTETLDDLPGKITGASAAHRVLFFFVFASGFSCLLFWQSALSPFPPVSGGFRNVQIIGLIFTFDLLIAIAVLSLRNISRITVACVAALMLFTRYGLFPVAPMWFWPAGEITNLYAILFDLGQSYLFVISLGLFIHAIIFLFFLLTDYSIHLKLDLLQKPEPVTLRNATIVSIIQDVMIPFGFLGLIAFFSYTALSMESTTIEHAIFNFIIFIICTGILFGMAFSHQRSAYRNKQSRVDLLRAFLDHLPDKKRSKIVSETAVFQRCGITRENPGTDILVIFRLGWMALIVMLAGFTGARLLL